VYAFPKYSLGEYRKLLKLYGPVFRCCPDETVYTNYFVISAVPSFAYLYWQIYPIIVEDLSFFRHMFIKRKLPYLCIGIHVLEWSAQAPCTLVYASIQPSTSNAMQCTGKNSEKIFSKFVFFSKFVKMSHFSQIGWLLEKNTNFEKNFLIIFPSVYWLTTKEK